MTLLYAGQPFPVPQPYTRLSQSVSVVVKKLYSPKNPNVRLDTEQRTYV